MSYFLFVKFQINLLINYRIKKREIKHFSNINWSSLLFHNIYYNKSVIYD